ncbi:ATP-dependent helicase [Myroides odoratimimus]|uniref:ATP-dependent helicase n=1 Tax=Myroides odoratimimus TaxID=76832 RepID=UPI002DBFC2D5|nr:ATP-dependent helicase [Myroides odoratimimus]MEC4043368.1 ATP-dependent helicase [Myroides odoratimimus]MEC4151242.1 ATP-dependent helicase [Myroides odoratimimus]
MMNKINLSPKQESIVNFNEGSILVLASAGSGKTRVLTERIKRISNYTKGKILAITFTNKAAAEIRERLNEQKEIKNVTIGTFHSFCQSILELRYKLLGYDKMPHIYEEDSVRVELIKEAILSEPYFNEIYESLESKDKNKYIYNALDFISTVKRDLISPEELSNASENEEYKFLFEKYQDLLRLNNSIDFDDIIKLVYELFTNNENVANLYRKTYEYICIDECQDLNKLQYYLLKSLTGDKIKNVMLVGDPNQAIYGFNGASPTFMLDDFIIDYDAKKIELEENYRSSKSVIEASNLLMDLKVPVNQFVLQGEFEIEKCNSEIEEANYVINKINNLIELKEHNDIEGFISYDKISILARNKFVFKNIEEKLKIDNIPYYYKSGNSGFKFTSTYLNIFELFFRITVNPLDKIYHNRLLNILKIDEISEHKLINSKFPISFEIFNLFKEINIENFHLKLKTLDILIKQNIHNDDEKKLAIDELNEYKELFTLYKIQNNKPTLGGFKSSIALGLTKLINKNEIGICLSTVHTMKGQESDIVFLIGMDEGTFPDFRAKTASEIQQEKNNAYVAFTRAKRFLYVSYPISRIMPWGDSKSRNISRFLKVFNQ